MKIYLGPRTISFINTSNIFKPKNNNNKSNSVELEIMTPMSNLEYTTQVKQLDAVPLPCAYVQFYHLPLKNSFSNSLIINIHYSQPNDGIKKKTKK